MKISKLTPIICALALGALLIPASAQDNAAQAAARAALSAQTPAASVPQPTNAPAAGNQAVQTKADKAAAKAKAKQAAADLKAKQDAEKQQAAQKAAQAQAAQTAAKAKPDQKQPSTAVVAAKPAVAGQAASGTNSYIGQDLGFEPIVAPALPISASKEARLNALLEQYKADKISPEDYHRQRSAILAEP
jgi:hypothetical protein